jgi:FAD/FMN-containing dehydrogenase
MPPPQFLSQAKGAFDRVRAAPRSPYGGDHRLWEPSDAAASAHERWADDLSDQLAPHALPGGYPNLLGPEEQDRLVIAYGPNAARLRELKRHFDPEGIFSSGTGTLGAPLG